MTEADRYLQNRGKQLIPGHLPPALPTGAEPHHGALPPPPLQGIKWLNFVNYVQLPVAGVFCLIALVLLFVNWSDLPNPGLRLASLALHMAVMVAMFLGLRDRTPWGWWLVMINFLLAAPVYAWSKYAAEVARVDLLNYARLVLGSRTSENMHADAGFYLMVCLALFLLLFLPQLVYFYNRRAMFGVRLGNDPDPASTSSRSPT